MEMTVEDVRMMRLVKQATAQGLVIAQDYQTREILLFAPAGVVHRHWDVAMVQAWLRHYAECGKHGRRCFVHTWFKCGCIPVLTASYHLSRQAVFS
ncbi:MAG: hypothetical protein ACR2H5_00285 [Ktedonobacteraceae bacterium]